MSGAAAAAWEIPIFAGVAGASIDRFVATVTTIASVNGSTRDVGASSAMKIA